MSSRNAATKQNNSRGGRTGAKTAREAGQTQREPLLSPGMRDDLIGVCLAVLGIVLFVAVVLPSNAPVSSTLARALRAGLGLGA